MSYEISLLICDVDEVLSEIPPVNDFYMRDREPASPFAKPAERAAA